MGAEMKRVERLTASEVLTELSEMYLSNPGSTGEQCPHPSEFVSCITSNRGSRTHLLWRRAYRLMHPFGREPKKGGVDG
jgi:hypothetical protein